MELEFAGEIWFWKGPAPHHFVTVPDQQCRELADVSREVTYGWGMIPVRAQLGGTEWTTSLFPKDGKYLVPIKTAVQRAEDLELGDVVTLRLVI